MKKSINPGLALSFGIGLVAIFALPPIVMAQVHAAYQVTISHKDTINNGKNITELSAGERKDKRSKLENLNHDCNFRI